MRFVILLPLAVVALLPFAEAILLLETSAATAATATTYGLTIGSGGAAAAAVAVAGALVLGGIALVAATNRGKRDVGAQCLPSNNPDLFITLAANSDRFGCGLRLVCELEATPDEQLNQDEKLILSLFGRHVKPATFSQLGTPKSGFLYAAFVGSTAKNVSECAEVFDQCVFDRETIMKAFNAQK
ncbi:uncharacterized protein LOC125044517 [Penaeus chinensis]|uniref:uncharacterized protein LOC125044517 n=1 Tax=Penaeus chinensis TaxID=139456 RepID=UPI001FB7884D|nr:uncharacterized protein LOC125044517 [Penaeus chinensis]